MCCEELGEPTRKNNNEKKNKQCNVFKINILKVWFTKFFYVQENYILLITAGSSNKCYFVAFLCLINES